MELKNEHIYPNGKTSTLLKKLNYWILGKNLTNTISVAGFGKWKNRLEITVFNSQAIVIYIFKLDKRPF